MGKHINWPQSRYGYYSESL